MSRRLPRRRNGEADMADDRTDALYLVAGIAAGAALGVVAALLLAPQPGTQTRKSVADVAERLKGQAERLAQQARTAAREIVTQQSERLAEAVEAGRQAAAEKREELRRRLEEAG